MKGKLTNGTVNVVIKDTGEARAVIYQVGSDEPDECITLN